MVQNPIDSYIEDAFTYSDGELELETDSIVTGCISSKNNSFSLDENGNLAVNSITFTGGQSGSGIFDLIYPIGSIYTSVNSANPSTLFGGTWEAFGSGRCLVGVDTSDTDFNTVQKTGGSKTNSTTFTPSGSITGTALSIDQIPSHSHSVSISGTTGDGGNHRHRVSTRTSTYGAGLQSAWRCITAPDSQNGDYWQDSYSEYAGSHTHGFTVSGNTGSNGGSNTHTHTFSGTQSTINTSSLQPYITVYMWKRTA